MRRWSGSQEFPGPLTRSRPNWTRHRVSAARIPGPKIVQQVRRKSVGFVDNGLLPQNVCQACHAARPKHRPRDGAATFRQGRDRLLHIAEIGVTCKGSVMTSSCAVHAEVELILMIGIIASPRVIICLTRQVGGNRKTRQQRLGHGIERHIDDIVWKLSSCRDAIDHGRRVRIKDMRRLP